MATVRRVFTFHTPRYKTLFFSAAFALECRRRVPTLQAMVGAEPRGSNHSEGAWPTDSFAEFARAEDRVDEHHDMENPTQAAQAAVAGVAILCARGRGARLASVVSKGWPAAAGLAALIPDLRRCPASSWPAASPVKR